MSLGTLSIHLKENQIPQQLGVGKRTQNGR
jgi:hypothetical protein